MTQLSDIHHPTESQLKPAAGMYCKFKSPPHQMFSSSDWVVALLCLPWPVEQWNFCVFKFPQSLLKYCDICFRYKKSFIFWFYCSISAYLHKLTLLLPLWMSAWCEWFDCLITLWGFSGSDQTLRQIVTGHTWIMMHIIFKHVCVALVQTFVWRHHCTLSLWSFSFSLFADGGGKGSLKHPVSGEWNAVYYVSIVRQQLTV